MTAAVALAEQRPAGVPLGGEDAGRPLDRVIAAVWEALAVRGTVECPVCGGRMEPEYGAAARPIGGRCTECGAVLS